MFSGLNLAFFSLSRLRLEIEAEHSSSAESVLAMRRDSNFLLTTILWGNVGINTLLALLANSVMVGYIAFLFSTVLITAFGEILPQAYFSRHALKMASALAPVLRFYQWLLYPVAKPSAYLLDIWLGRESIQLMREKIVREFIIKHIASDEGEIAQLEGIGALNFFDIDDLLAHDEGELVDEKSVINLEVKIDLPIVPKFQARNDDPFLLKVHAAKKKWVILTDTEDNPQLMLLADDFLREVMFSDEPVDIYRFCHRPIVVRNPKTPLGDIILQIKKHSKDEVDKLSIKHDVALIWTSERRRIITGADILGQLLHGIA